MSITEQLLHADWQFAFAPYAYLRSPGDAHRLDFRAAAVPGVNLLDLQAHGLVKRETAADYEASFAPFAKLDFIYRSSFPPPREAMHQELCFDGLDTVCDIFLNNERLAHTENVHRRYRFDVSGRLRADNELALIFRSPVHETEARARKGGGTLANPWNLPYMFLRKPAYSYFWDWGPSIPVSGIFRRVYLCCWNEGRIEDFQLRYDVHGRAVSGSVDVIVAGHAREARLRLAGQESTAPLQEGRARIAFVLPEAELWYPNGEGEPYLYPMELELRDRSVLDKQTRRVGFRTIEVLRDARADGRGTRFLFRVNGRDIFCRGYNWIPADNAIPRAYPDMTRALLDLARDGGVNMLRIWGGGYYPPTEFFAWCDERGILVWQDGMFACALYPDHDLDFLDEVGAELADNIRRLRNHPSLALWCGENECHWGYEEWWQIPGRKIAFRGGEIWDRMFPTLVANLDPDRLYWNGSPWSGPAGHRGFASKVEQEDGKRHAANDPLHGDTHFWTLHGSCEDYSEYRKSLGSFISETGIQSMPDLLTALSVEDDDRHLQSLIWDTRNHFGNPAKNERLLKFMGALFRIPSDFEHSVYVSNLAQAEYLKFAVEHWRSLAYDCAGVLLWQLNDCWPAVSWSVVDCNLIPKAAYYYLKRAFQPWLVGWKTAHSFNYDASIDGKGELFIAAERDGVHRGELQLRVLGVDGTTHDEKVLPFTLEARGVISLGEYAVPDFSVRRRDGVLQLHLRLQDGTECSNVYTLGRPKHMHLPDPELSLSACKGGVRVRAERFAKGVYLHGRHAGACFSDNYFDLLPGEARIIATTLAAGGMEMFSYHH